MEFTHQKINPYREILLNKVNKKENSFDEYEEIFAVVDYVDRVQVQAMLENNSSDIDEEISVEKAVSKESESDDLKAEFLRMKKEFEESLKKGNN